jgi:5'-nucleotidase
MPGSTPSDVIALVDMDGTACDYAEAMARDLEALRSPGETYPDDHFNDGVDRAWLKARRRMIKAQPDWWLNLKPLKVGMALVELLRANAEVHVLTKGPSSNDDAWSQKVTWCRRHFPSDVKITVTEDKGLSYGRILVDDWPSYVTRWLEWRPRGLVLMPDQPWNQDFEHPNVRRVKLEDVEQDGEVYFADWLVEIVESALNRTGGEMW